tara:strand:+ start:319 stop:855 length:537 start_codon:yes stop_codon:yes gene_type:complete
MLFNIYIIEMEKSTKKDINKYKKSLSYLLGIDIKLINIFCNKNVINKKYLNNSVNIEELLDLLNNNKYFELQDILKKIFSKKFIKETNFYKYYLQDEKHYSFYSKNKELLISLLYKNLKFKNKTILASSIHKKTKKCKHNSKKMNCIFRNSFPIIKGGYSKNKTQSLTLNRKQKKHIN